jgi:hypothetical protein
VGKGGARKWVHVLKGEDRLRAAANIYTMRLDGLTFRAIGETLGIPVQKVALIHQSTDRSLFEKYLKEENNE